MQPLVRDGAIPVELRARLTTGEQLVARSNIMLMREHENFDAMVPGALSYVQNRNTWNIIRAQA